MVADVSCQLLEVDFAGIESALTGWYLWRHQIDPVGARNFIRLARLGMHAAVTSLKVGKPCDLTWPDDRLGAYLADIKTEYSTPPHQEYDICKRANHGTDYGLTPYGMVEQFPDYFKTLKEATETQNFLFTLAPGLPKWHGALRTRAREMGYLGGPTLSGRPMNIWDHPYGYKHWFWDVITYRPCDESTARKWLRDPARNTRIVQIHGRWFQVLLGGDSKRVVSFYPQSTAAAVLKRAESLLFSNPDSPDYIGDAYFGRTPLLQPIHDSLFLHLPNRVYDRVLDIVVRVMQSEIPELPIPIEWGWGSCLRIGVEAKGGRTWDQADMHKIPVPPLTFMPVAVVEDAPTMPRDEADYDVWEALRRRVA